MVSLIAAGALVQPAVAQVRIHVNIDLQPSWGPSGYDYAEYYYMPAMDMYYYIPARKYIYRHRGRWVRTRYVPTHFRHVDFYRTYKVVINDRDPFRHHDTYRTRYARYRDRYDQPVWRDVRDRGHRNGNRYEHRNDWNNDQRNWDNNRGNNRPENRQWNNDKKDNRGNGHNNGRGNGRGKDKHRDRGNGAMELRSL